MLHDEILKVLNGTTNNGGVSSGKDGLIRFCDGKELGVNNYCLIINKVNSETGEVTSSYAYEFKSKYHYAIENFDPNNSSHKKAYYDDIEVKQLLDLLRTYYEAMTGAQAYSALDAFRFINNSTSTKIDLIMSKLGVEYKSGMTSRTSNRSYFDTTEPNPSDRSMRSATMDELE